MRAHYEIERELADRLRESLPRERAALYGVVYDELFRRVSDHPQLNDSAADRKRWVEAQIELLAPLLTPSSSLLEIGAGDCALSLALAPRVREVRALDVSEEIAPEGPTPANFSFVLSDGLTMPVAARSVDLAYSNQLMEHLHPEDAHQQLKEIARSLAPGGQYLCVTPHRFSGPHDVSGFFDREATGFHLKEYTVGELCVLLRDSGFEKLQVVVLARGRRAVLPATIVVQLERALGRVPRPARRWLARSPLRAVLGVTMLATR
ncbi:MAG: class I SAM-dependent methyltransferase [Solirubrobacteraceae bacterium]